MRGSPAKLWSFLLEALTVETSGNNQQQFTCASVIKGIRLRNYNSCSLRTCSIPLSDVKILLISSNVYMKIVFKLFIVKKHVNLKSLDSLRSWRYTNVPSLQRLRRPETRRKLHFFVNSRLLLPKKSSQLEMYLILSNFLNLMYVRSVTWCACFPRICIVCCIACIYNCEVL